MNAPLDTAAAFAAAEPEKSLIVTEALKKAYGYGPLILDGVDLAVNEGEAVALIGANGSGKSTLLKCLIGLHPITAGAVSTFGIRFEGTPKTREKAKIRRQVGFVFQNHGLVRRLSALSNVVQGRLGQPGGLRAVHQAIAPAEWREAAFQALDEVGLADKAGARADQLSGGQAQRVAIARALTRRPRLIIADEPAASLDPAAGHEVMALFRRLAKESGITLIFTSHDMEHARDYSDRVIALKNGCIHFDRRSKDVRDGALEEVFRG